METPTNLNIHNGQSILRARWVLPITAPPLEEGEVVIEEGKIVEVRQQSNLPASDCLDFGDAVIMPGLVNVHTHLDYTLMRGLLEDIAFFPWIRELTLRKSVLTEEDWLASAAWGAAEAIAGGVTSIGDCTDSGAAQVGASTFGLRGTIYQEVFGIDNTHSVETILEDLKTKVIRHKEASQGSRLQIGISPHAPYTVRPELMLALQEYAASENLPICIHAAESRAEAQLILSGSGVIAEMFERRGIEWTPPAKSTVAYLAELGILDTKTLLVHGVQVSASDRHIARQTGFSWAHCPKSNAKLGNGVAPLGLLADLPPAPNPDWKNLPPARIGLGTDGVASNNTMDMFEEMRFAVLMQRAARQNFAALNAQTMLEMATLGGAVALGIQDKVGSLEPAKAADICVVQLQDLHNIPFYDPYNALVYAARASDVVYTCIDGDVRYDARSRPPLEQRFPQNQLIGIRQSFQNAVHKMRTWRPS